MAAPVQTKPLSDQNNSIFETWPEISRLEVDRFCFACGYNLHHQTVRREPRTEVLMCRCPECGTFHPVAVPASSWQNWMQRFKGLFMVAWMGIVLSIGFTAGVLHGVAVYFTLDEFTGYYDQMARQFIYELKPFYWERRGMWWLVCLISGSSSFGLAMVGTMLALIFMPHWSKRAQAAIVIVWAVLPALIAAFVFWAETGGANSAPRWDLMAWGAPYILTYVCCYLAGGVLALLIGRGLVRLLIRITVPPRWRVHLQAIKPQ
jgi:hypothetical protein